MSEHSIKFTTRDLELVNHTIDILTELRDKFSDLDAIKNLAVSKGFLIESELKYNFGVCTFIRGWADSTRLYDRFDYLISEFANSKRLPHISYAYPVENAAEFYSGSLDQIWNNPIRYELIKSCIKSLVEIKNSLEDMNYDETLTIKFNRVKASEIV